MFRLLICVFALACASQTAYAAELLRAQGHTFRWGTGQQSAPQTITYALVTTTYAVPGGKSVVSPDNCGAMRAFNDIVANSPAVSQTAALDQLEAAFAQWQEAANITFIRVDDPARANIVVGAAERTSGRAFANLSYRSSANLQPVGKALGGPAEDTARRPSASASVVEIDQAYVCLNPVAPWKIGFDGDLQVYDLKYTFTHEIGHAIGLDHPGRTGAIMGYRYDETSPALREGDIVAAQSIYGPRGAKAPVLD